MTRAAIITIAFWLIWTVFTTVFAASANKAEVRALPKWLWVLICLFVPFFGGLLYLMVGRPLRKERMVATTIPMRLRIGLQAAESKKEYPTVPQTSMDSMLNKIGFTCMTFTQRFCIC
jgi:hypothetical protein